MEPKTIDERGEFLEPIELQRGNGQIVTFETDELTAFCPFDFGGPDFYELTVRFELHDIPSPNGLESRSFKKYIESWRHAEISAEDMASEIYEDISSVIDAQILYICLEQARRGGIEERVEVGNDPLRVRY